MNTDFIIYEFQTEFKTPPFRTEILNTFYDFVKANDLVLPDFFDQRGLNTYGAILPTGYRIEYSFLARTKTPDEKLGECIEYHISNL